MVGCIWKSLRGEVKRRYALLVGSAPRYWRLNLRLGGLVSQTHYFALRSQGPDVEHSAPMRPMEQLEQQLGRIP